MAPLIFVLSITAAAANAQGDSTSGPRRNNTGPTVAQIRAEPIDFRYESVSPFLGYSIGPLEPAPDVNGLQYKLPDGSRAVLFDCSPQQRCEGAAFVVGLGSVSDDDAYAIEDVLSYFNLGIEPEEEGVYLQRDADGQGILAQEIALTDATPAGYFHGRYHDFLEGIEKIEEEGIVSRTMPPSPLIEKWGIFVALEAIGWWLDTGKGGYVNYSWIVPGEQLGIQSFDRFGKRTSMTVLSVNGNVISGPNWGSRTLLSREPLRTAYGDGRIDEVDEQLYEHTITSVQNGNTSQLRSIATSKPRFPDAAMIASANGVNPCPGTEDELARFLAPQRVLSNSDEVQAVATDDFVFGGNAGERSYDTRSMTFLGVRPVSVKAAITGGKPFSLEIMLPGADPRSFEPLFRASFRTGTVQCTDYGDYGSCDWKSREDSWNAPEGVLTSVGIGRTIFSETETRLICSYR